MKKIIVFITLTAVLAFSMTACSSNIPDGSETELFRPGTYKVTVDGRNGPIVIETVLSKNKVVRIEVLDHSESAGIGDVALQSVANDIITRQSFEVDVVSGATESTYAMLKAVSASTNAAGADFPIIEKPRR